MCTAATYKTKDFYFGRTFDYEFSYGEGQKTFILAELLTTSFRMEKRS